MTRQFLPLALILMLAVNATAADLKTRLEKRMVKSGFKSAEIGVWVHNGESTVYEKNADVGFIPASLSKIPTAAAILSLFPQGHRFKTTFAADAGEVSAQGKVRNGILKGSLYLVGGGDPSFVSENLWFLVNELTRSGLSVVEGDLVVDDSQFDTIRFGDDRQSVRVDRAYDAPIGAMSLNWNSITAWVRPSTNRGDTADIQLDIASGFSALQNKTKTSGSGASVSIERLNLQPKQAAPGLHEIFLATGTVGADQAEKAIYKSVREPNYFAGYAALEFLKQRGITVKGMVKAGVKPPGAVIIATAESKALPSIVADMLKWSNNYVAEMLVKGLAVLSGERPATMRTGIAQVRSYLEKSVKLRPGSYEFINAAGFTRENKLSPTQMGQVLTTVRRDFRIFPEFASALPIAGVDGTLRNRFKGLAGAGLVRAKTGLLNGAIGLAGFASEPSGRLYSFVFLFNGPAGKEDSARVLFDQMASELAGPE